MKRVNVMVSDQAKDRLVEYQKYHRLNTQDETLSEILEAIAVPKDKPARITEMGNDESLPISA